MGSEGGRRLDPLAEAFAGSADSYDRARPGYDDEPLDWAFREMELDEGSVVLDLAAGTGKLSQALAPRAGRLIAVEPLPEMRRLLAARAPEATLLDGTAEQIPMDDGSVDAVFVGEAFHWFDGARALPEMHRVLRPAGGLALLWHNVSWHDTAAWADEFEVRLHEVPAPDVRPENRPHTLRWQGAFAGNALFTPLEHREFRHPITVDAEQIVQLVLSWSYVAALPEADRELLGRDLSQIVHNHAGDAPLELPFVTYVYLTRKHQARPGHALRAQSPTRAPRGFGTQS